MNFCRGNCEAIPEEFSGQGTTPPKPGILGLVVEVNREEESNLSSYLPSSEEKSPEPNTDYNLLPSFSFEDVNTKPEDGRLENRFFDKQSMPNEHFEFSRSASVSQVRTNKYEYLLRKFSFKRFPFHCAGCSAVQKVQCNCIFHKSQHGFQSAASNDQTASLSTYVRSETASYH